MKHSWNRQAQAQRALENVAVGDNTAAASDEALLQQAKLKSQDALKNVFFGDDRPAGSDRARCLKHASKNLHGVVRDSMGLVEKCVQDRGIEQKSTRWCGGRLDLNPRKCIQGPEVSNARAE